MSVRTNKVSLALFGNKHVFGASSNITIGITTSILVASMIGTILSSSPASAYTASISASSNFTLTANPSNDGTAIESDTINVISDCRNGYNLTISTSTSSDLYRYENNTKVSNTATFTAVDGTSALSSSNNTNKWGYTLTSNPTGSTIFSPLSTTPSTLRTASQTASPSSDINDTFNIYYGIKVGDNIDSGIYKMDEDINNNPGTIVYHLTMDTSCTIYSIQYDGNTPDNPNGMGTTDSSTGIKSVKQTNIAEGTKVTLLASNFKKDGYGFLGWSTDIDAYTHFTDNDNTNDPIIYGPMEDITLDSNIMAKANSKNIITMYAVWVPAKRTNPSDPNSTPVYFQDWDNPNTALPHDGCSTLTQTTFNDNITEEKSKITVNKNSIIALTDKRDNMTYAVSRLADGNCWMIENLRLNDQYTMGQNQNDPNETNQNLSQGYGGTTGTYGNFVGLANSESANFSNSTTSNSVYKSSLASPTDTYDPTNNVLEDIGTTNSPGYRFPRYNNNNTSSMLENPTYTQNYANASNPSNTPSSNYYRTQNLYSYGNYYTWSAAMANTNYYTSSSTSEASGTSICPAGWHLPSSNGTNKEFGTLSQGYGGSGNNQDGAANAGDIMSNRFRSFPNNFLYSGGSSGSSAYKRGTGGIYWSRSAYNLSNSYSLLLNSTTLYPSGSSYKFNDWSVRCLMGTSDVEVALDSNNGTGAISRVYGTAGSTVTLPSSSNPSASIAVYGFIFKNWNTAQDGLGTSYTSSYAIPADSTGITLYAQWTPQYTITYVNNCITYASANDSCTQSVSDGTSVQKIDLDANGDGSGTLAAYNKWTLTGWKIKGWSTVPDNSSNANTEYGVSTTYSVTGQAAGNSITLYAHWVPVYSIQYDGNNADNPNGMGTTDSSTGVKSVKQTNVGEGDPVILLASNFKRNGYGFIGWSTDSDAWTHFTDNDNTNDPIIYGPMETISAPAYPNNGTNIITMYAVWVPAKRTDPTDPSSDPVYLQEWDDPTDPNDGCAALVETTFNDNIANEKDKITVNKNSIIALTDKRDNMVYAIAKLADNNCWMIENLRLDDQHTMGQNQNDPNEINQNLSQGYGGTTGTYGNFVGLANSESANFSDSTTSNSVYKSSLASPTDTYDPTNNVLEDIGTTNNPAYRFPRYSNSNTNNLINNPTYTQNYANASSPSNTPSSNYYQTQNLYSYGNYYTWSAAMANTNYYTSSSTSEAADTSICPSGWHLPSSGGAAKEFGTLSQGYGGSGNNQDGTANAGDIMSNRFRSFPNNFLYSGYFNSSSANYRGTYGYYWSSSAYNNRNSYNLNLDSTNFYPSYSYHKHNGRSVRCLIGS